MYMRSLRAWINTTLSTFSRAELQKLLALLLSHKMPCSQQHLLKNKCLHYERLHCTMKCLLKTTRAHRNRSRTGIFQPTHTLISSNRQPLAPWRDRFSHRGCCRCRVWRRTRNFSLAQFRSAFEICFRSLPVSRLVFRTEIAFG